jgi:hypothetical protein
VVDEEEPPLEQAKAAQRGVKQLRRCAVCLCELTSSTMGTAPSKHVEGARKLI